METDSLDFVPIIDLDKLIQEFTIWEEVTMNRLQQFTVIQLGYLLYV